MLMHKKSGCLSCFRVFLVFVSFVFLICSKCLTWLVVVVYCPDRLLRAMRTLPLK